MRARYLIRRLKREHIARRRAPWRFYAPPKFGAALLAPDVVTSTEPWGNPWGSGVTPDGLRFRITTSQEDIRVDDPIPPAMLVRRDENGQIIASYGDPSQN